MQKNIYLQCFKDEVYHHGYNVPSNPEHIISEYMQFYNNERPHRKLNMKTPFQFETEFYMNA
jgi:transposase InsO family protein